MSGLTRNATRATVPCATARWSMRSSSPGDSTLMASRPSDTARSISAALLPTPVNTIWSGRKPQRSATSTSPSELASPWLPSDAQQPDHGQRRIGLERVVNGVRVAVERLVERRVGGANQVGVVDVARRADGGRDLLQPRGRSLQGCRGSGRRHSLDLIVSPRRRGNPVNHGRRTARSPIPGRREAVRDRTTGG